MHTELQKIKEKLKKVDHFCKGQKALPSDASLAEFIETENLQECTDYAKHLLNATRAKEWLLFQNQTNRRRRGL